MAAATPLMTSAGGEYRIPVTTSFIQSTISGQSPRGSPMCLFTSFIAPTISYLVLPSHEYCS